MALTIFSIEMFPSGPHGRLEARFANLDGINTSPIIDLNGYR